MNGVRIRAYAKLNLTLDVTGAEGGYHLLDSFVASVSLFDLSRPAQAEGRAGVRDHARHGQREHPPPKRTTRKGRGTPSCANSGAGAPTSPCIKTSRWARGWAARPPTRAGVLSGMAALYGADEAKLGALAETPGQRYPLYAAGRILPHAGQGRGYFPRARGREAVFSCSCAPVLVRRGTRSGACYKEFRPGALPLRPHAKLHRPPSCAEIRKGWAGICRTRSIPRRYG